MQVDVDWIVIALLVLLLWLLISSNRRRGKWISDKWSGADSRIVSKGELGEYEVTTGLAKLPEEYHVFNDVYLECEGYSSQIDHVVISQYGVFVIETKNYSGAVYGSENVKHWTQYLRGQRYEFLNPINQNRSHELAIKNTLHIASTSVIPIVVFLDRADLHCKTTSVVLYASQLRDYILSRKAIAFTSDGVERLVKRLSGAIVTDPDRRINHIRNIRQSIADREIQVANHICPRCGGRLVERKGLNRHFLGCSNYPRCKFTAQL